MTQKNALLSVFDKTGIVDFARALTELGWNLYSSGGTAKEIAEAGLPVTDVAVLTSYPAILGHRVVTLHPKVHGGILGRPDVKADQADMQEYGIKSFGLVVVSLYPFADTVASGASFAECIEKIDVGGPTMVRGAAKNHQYVGIVTSPDQYPTVLEELREAGELSHPTRKALAAKAFAHTAAYDAAVATWIQDGELLPDTLHLSLTRAPQALRYGENPHQKAAVYVEDGASPWWINSKQYSGLAMSYLNLYDTDAAWRLVHEAAFGQSQAICAIIKHANPCGFAIADNLAAAYKSAFECDERSAFGGIVAFNRVIDEETAEAMMGAAQADVVIAPGYAPGVIERLQAKRKNTRLLEAIPPTASNRHLRPITGGMLVQEPHRFVALPEDWQVVTDRQPSKGELADAWTAHIVCGYTKSNSIVLVKDGVAWGIGAGQQNRVESGQIAAQKANGRAAGGACASDAFYPFPDGIEAAAQAGVSVIVQPGGSVKDPANIAKANELGLSMVFTGERHFLH